MDNDNPPFGERYLSGSFQPPVSHTNVRRLAFEGGGGKGNAYLGALYALDQLGVLGQLDTVAGSSAGAITALTLSLGMRPSEVFGFMKGTNFAKFFDQQSNAIPTLGKPYEESPSEKEKALRAVVTAAWAHETRPVHLVGRIAAALKTAISGVSSAIVGVLLRGLYRVEDVTFALTALRLGPLAGPAPTPRSATAPPEPTSLPAQVLDQLLASLPSYLTSLSLDMGVFSGETARDRFASLIAERIGANVDLTTGSSSPGAPVDGRSVTFAQLDNFCSAHKYPLLRVASSELCSLKTVIFSGKHTPNFPVADAVRMSMGLPFVYKPYTIRSTGSGLPPCGVYVDGGVFSNLPLLAFSDKETSEAIGLRLEIDYPTRIDGFLGLLRQIAKASLLAGESGVVADRAERSVRLDTEPLGLFDFSADQDTLATVSMRAHLTTMLFFGQGADYKPVDLASGVALSQAQATGVAEKTWKELRESVERRRQASGCVFENPCP
jgi:predicted acylesterase/phospholipase RssA